MLFLLFDGLRTDRESGPANTESMQPGDTVDFRNYLLDHLTSNKIDNLRLGELAEKIHLTEKQINRIVKQRYHMTFKQKQIRFRLENAKKQLQESTLPVDEIARQVGYTNLTSFYRAFRKLLGMSPGEYRRECNKKRK